MIYQNILETIGNTHLVKINKLNPNKNVNIYAKLEGQNPGGSIKDRVGLSMIEAAEKSGELTKKKIILEPTSGNTGIGIALVAAIKGYKAVLVMSAAMSEERKKMLRVFGAKLVESDPTKGTDGAIAKALEIYKKEPKKYWMPYQFSNPNNTLAHYYGTAKEIINDLPEIDYLVAGMGTTGTLMGVSKKLKEYKPDIKIIGIEPQMKHKIAGLKNMKEAIVPKIYDKTKLDKKITVYNEEAYETTRQLALQEGIFVGMSSGAAMFGALKFSKNLKRGNLVVIFPDRGEKYLSNDLFK